MPSIPVVDIFAGAGGLGEGFAAYPPRSPRSGGFRVVLSAEMDADAVRTLRTRAFYRQFEAGSVPESYYDYAAGQADEAWTSSTQRQWRAAQAEAMQIELGVRADDVALFKRVESIAREANERNEPWVLIGGPPCQAYSLVGRARNKGNAAYIPGLDPRHFLYEHYLRIISKFQPAVFVLENVKGMLSAKIDGIGLFDEIFERLQQPGGKKGPRYRIEPLVESARGNADWQPKDFLVRTEEHGIPQARHRVILVGVRDDIGKHITPISRSGARFTVEDAIGGLPMLRSSLTDLEVKSWPALSSRLLERTARMTRSSDRETSEVLALLASEAAKSGELKTGSRWESGTTTSQLPPHLDRFIRDPRLRGVLNHQTRGHMHTDLMRYGFAAAFAKVHGRSPRGAREFPAKLHPVHRNWATNDKFIDRFKVQRSDMPSSTITSHLAKDGHYFIHPDPLQLRSLTVREAARLQTFPDNFIFEGSLGAQRKQVGNAVPPLLGYQIAAVIDELLR